MGEGTERVEHLEEKLRDFSTVRMVMYGNVCTILQQQNKSNLRGYLSSNSIDMLGSC